VALDQVTLGHPVNMDGHNVKTYSRKAMKHAFIAQEDRYGKAIRTFYTQDQASQKPLLALAASSGTTVSQVTHRLAGLTRHPRAGLPSGRRQRVVLRPTDPGTPRPIWRRGLDTGQVVPQTPGGV
jgi:hypothetical protein